MTLWLSRLTLDRRAGNAAVAPLLDPDDEGAALDAHHRLLWAPFADDGTQGRDFLWRAEKGGRFLILSRRPPAAHPLFLAPEVKEFAPALAPGDRLAFALRANATRDRAAISRLAKEERRSRSRRVDVVMHALRDLPEGAGRAAERFRVASETGRQWLAAQGGRAGFRLAGFRLEDYRTLPLRGSRHRPGRLGILDMTGVLEITEPAAFLERLSQGFGRARAFGCGLMLIRRA